MRVAARRRTGRGLGHAVGSGVRLDHCVWDIAFSWDGFVAPGETVLRAAPHYWLHPEHRRSLGAPTSLRRVAE